MEKDDVRMTGDMLQKMTVIDTATVKPCTLAALIRESPESTLLVDCRGFTDFNESHIGQSINAFFSKMIRRRLVENKLDNNYLLNQLMNCTGLKNMDEKLDVVLYAEEDKPRANKRRIASCNAPESSTKMLRVLQERLDDTERFRSVMILEGGYKQFAAQYPQLCDSTEGMTRLPQSLSQPCLMNPSGDGITLITPNIYLGSQMDSLDEKTLKALDITAVINLSVTCPKSICITEDKNFMRIPVNDSYQEKLSPYFVEAFEFLERCRLAGKKCLIHCLAGISRSPTLCISYIMRANKIGSEEAYRYIKQRRPSISPNFNFMGQLLEYENQLIKEHILKPEQASRQPSQRNVVVLNPSLPTECCSHSVDLCPPKVPKSASSHCVFVNQNQETISPIGTTSSDSEPSNQVNENGKREMSLDFPMRPKVLGLSSRMTTVLKDLPSPSTEFSRLNFDNKPENNEPKLAFANPCFMSPVAPTREICVPLGNAMENPMYFQKKSSTDCEPSCSTAPAGSVNSSGFSFFARPKKLMPTITSRTSRPECLRGVMMHNNTNISTDRILSTTEETEEDAESPESGFNEEMKSCPEDDSVSISSASSLEITCK